MGGRSPSRRVVQPGPPRVAAALQVDAPMAPSTLLLRLLLSACDRFSEISEADLAAWDPSTVCKRHPCVLAWNGDEALACCHALEGVAPWPLDEGAVGRVWSPAARICTAPVALGFESAEPPRSRPSFSRMRSRAGWCRRGPPEVAATTSASWCGSTRGRARRGAPASRASSCPARSRAPVARCRRAGGRSGPGRPTGRCDRLAWPVRRQLVAAGGSGATRLRSSESAKLHRAGGWKVNFRCHAAPSGRVPIRCKISGQGPTCLPHLRARYRRDAAESLRCEGG